MAAIFRQAEFVLVGDPGQLGRELLPLALRGVDRNDESSLRAEAQDFAFDAADMVDIGDDAVAELNMGVRLDLGVARRHVDDHAIGFFARCGQHGPCRLTDTRWNMRWSFAMGTRLCAICVVVHFFLRISRFTLNSISARPVNTWFSRMKFCIEICGGGFSFAAAIRN